MEELQNFIKTALPNLSQDGLENLVQHLVDNLGLSTPEECVYIKEEDVANHLKPIQIRRFLDFCQKGK